MRNPPGAQADGPVVSTPLVHVWDASAIATFQVRWRINADILDTVLVCLRDKIAVGDLPVMNDLPLPPVPEGVVLDGSGKLKAPFRRDDEPEEDFKERRKTHYTYKRLVDKVSEEAWRVYDCCPGLCSPLPPTAKRAWRFPQLLWSVVKLSLWMLKPQITGVGVLYFLKCYDLELVRRGRDVFFSSFSRLLNEKVADIFMRITYIAS